MYFAKIDTASSGNTTLVAANANARIRVHNYVFVAGGTVNVKFVGGSTDLTGAMTCSSGSGVSSPGATPTTADQEACLFYTAKNEALIINLSGAVQVSGHLAYSLEPA